MDLVLILSLCFLVLLAIFIYSLLFGHTDFHQNGCVGRLNSFFLDEFPLLFFVCIRKLCGEKGERRMKVFGNYLMGKNPLLQIFFITLLSSGFLIFYFSCFDYLPLIHKMGACILVLTTFYLFYKSCKVDPGFISTENYSKYEKNYPNDGVLYVSNICYQCKIVRPARSKHCKVCGKCVARYDHHCPWINNCVGANNIRYFLSFLLFTSICCFYGVYEVYYIAYYKIIIPKQMLYWYIDNQPIPLLLFFQFLFSYMGSAMFGLGLFLLLTGITMAIFFLYHFYLILRNTTTLETIKWKQAHHIFRLQSKGIYQSSDDSPTPPNNNNNNNDAEKNDDNNAENNNNNEKANRKIMLIKQPVNIYHRGIIANIYESISPISQRKNNITRPSPSMMKKLYERDLVWQSQRDILRRKLKEKNQ